MHPPTHFLISWAVANTAKLERRDRTLVTVSGIVADVDGAGVVVELLTRDSENPLMWFAEYHHELCHNLTFGIVYALFALAIARRRVVTALMSLGVFHLHLLCDILGARGPDGSQWPIPYFAPFSDSPSLAWSGQWYLHGWPNMLITGVMVILTFYLAWKRGFSFVGIFSEKADEKFVAILRKRFGEPRGSP